MHVQLIAQWEQEAGNVAFTAGQFTDALAHYSRALQEQPLNAVLLSNRAACYLAMKWQVPSLRIAIADLHPIKPRNTEVQHELLALLFSVSPISLPETQQ